jgi:hypothetical protein
MRKFRLTRWQVLLGVSLTVAWCGFLPAMAEESCLFLGHVTGLDPHGDNCPCEESRGVPQEPPGEPQIIRVKGPTGKPPFPVLACFDP